jgi:hypothetical protein
LLISLSKCVNFVDIRIKVALISPVMVMAMAMVR